jgi:hypothetical protein
LFWYVSETGKIPQNTYKSWHRPQEADQAMIRAAAEQENHPAGAN